MRYEAIGPYLPYSYESLHNDGAERGKYLIYFTLYNPTNFDEIDQILRVALRSDDPALQRLAGLSVGYAARNYTNQLDFNFYEKELQRLGRELGSHDGLDDFRSFDPRFKARLMRLAAKPKYYLLGVWWEFKNRTRPNRNSTHEES